MLFVYGFPNRRSAPITQGAAGSATVVGGRAGFKIVVYGMSFTLSAAGTAKFQSNATNLTGPYDVDIRGGLVCPPANAPIFETASGEALNIVTTLGAANGVLQYEQVEG